jgi:precorrin isomerase
VEGEAFATRNKLNLRMDLAIGRKPDYRPVGYMAHAEGRKSIKQTPSNKVRVISRRQGRGLAAGLGLSLL